MDFWNGGNNRDVSTATLRNCDSGTKTSPYQYGPWGRSYSYDMYYPGEWAWCQFARDILEYFMVPTTEEGHQKLKKEILEGDDLQGFLDLGNEQKFYWNFNILLALITSLGFLAFLGGIGYMLYRKKASKDVENKCDRVKLIPLFLMHILLFILVAVSMVLFTIALWDSKVNPQDDPTNDGLRVIKDEYAWIVKEGKCYYEVSIEGVAESIKKEITDFSSNFTNYIQLSNNRYMYKRRYYDDNRNKVLDSLQRKLQNHLSLIKIDQKSVTDLRMASSKMFDQLNELKKLETVDSKFTKQVDEISALMKTTDKDLLEIYMMFEDASPKLGEEFAAMTNKINDAVLSASQPLLQQLDDWKSRVKVVVDSVHSAYRNTADWINVVAKRNSKTIEGMKKQGSLTKYYVYAQVAIAVPSISALIALALGFFALALRIVHPKALGLCSSGTRKTRRFISFVFFVQCIFVGVVAFIAGMGLHYSGHLNAACVPMYTRDYPQIQIDKFYEDIGVGLKLIDYNGTLHQRNFPDLFLDSTIARTTSNIKTRYGNFEILQTDSWWNSVNSVFEKIDAYDLKFDYQEKIGEKMKLINSEFDEIRQMLLDHSTTSTLYLLVEKQIIDFQKKLENTNFPSLGEIDWFKERGLTGDVKISVEGLFRKGMGDYYNYLVSIPSGNLKNAYWFTGETICINVRTSAAGIWFSCTCLSIILLVSAVVMLKTATTLEGDFETKGVPISVSTIYSPLIDDEKNPTEPEII